MIDYETYQALHDSPEEDHTHNAPQDIISADSTDEPDERLLLSLPAQIRGFGFHDKKWSASLRSTSHRISQLTSH